MARWTDEDRARWRALYEDGHTYEQIALEYGSSQGVIRSGVLKVGGKSRPSGQRTGTPQKKRASSSGGVVSVPSSGARRQGKRRRGRPRHL